MGDETDSTKNIEQAVRMGNLEADALSFGSSADLANSSVNQSEARRKKERDHGLILELQGVDQFLKRLEASIAALEAQLNELRLKRDEARLASDTAFNQMHQAEELMQNLKDGVSAEERQQLIKMLGPDAKDAPSHELILMLQAHIAEQRLIGLDNSEKADALDQRIAEDQQILDALKAEQAAYESANSPEERVAIQQRVEQSLSSLSSNSFEDQLEDNVDFDVLDFPIGGHDEACLILHIDQAQSLHHTAFAACLASFPCASR